MSAYWQRPEQLTGMEEGLELGSLSAGAAGQGDKSERAMAPRAGGTPAGSCWLWFCVVLLAVAAALELRLSFRADDQRGKLRRLTGIRAGATAPIHARDLRRVDFELPIAGSFARQYAGSGSPPNITRDATVYDWCRRGTGLATVTFWADGDQAGAVTVSSGDVLWVHWNTVVEGISWQCSGSTRVSHTGLRLAAGQWLSLQLRGASRGSRLTGRLKWNTWTSTHYISSIPFTSGTEGYECFKIPSYLKTINGTILAFAEARGGSCGDFDSTELVYKRSTDGGLTWEPVQRLVKPQGDVMALGLCGNPLVIGNAAPVQLSDSSARHPRRILVPHTRNNFKTWMVYSDDDGATWSDSVEIPGVQNVDASPDCNRNMSYFGQPTVAGVKTWIRTLCAGSANRSLDPYVNPKWRGGLAGPWQFIGTGPASSLQLRSGRVLVPAYHSYIRGATRGNAIGQLYNNFALGHTIVSDDDGDSWRLGWQGSPIGQGANENQYVELQDGSVLLNARSLSTGSPQFRLQARSTDRGESFGASDFVREQGQPFNGCQGSTIGGGGDTVYVASPDPEKSDSLLQRFVDYLGCSDVSLTGRARVSVWKSTDGGWTYPEKLLIDPGLSGQTSLQHANGRLTLLHEQSDPPPGSLKSIGEEALIENLYVLIPDRFVYRGVDGI